MKPSSNVKYRSLADLHKLPGNPRQIKDADFNRLCVSIKNNPEYFEARPIILSDRTGQLVIIAGNQRYDAAMSVGLEEVPTFLLSGLTEEKEREIIIRDNVSNGEWDMDLLSAQFNVDDLKDWGVSIPDDFGKEPEAASDDNYDVPDEIQTDIKPGDVIFIGGHRLMCGDSSNASDFAILMDGEKADMVFTDPPYGVSIGKKNVMLNSFQKAGRNLTDIVDDDMKPDDLKVVLVKAFTNIKQNIKDCCTLFVTAPQGGELGMMMMMMMKESGLPIRHVLMWYKNAPTFSMGRLDYDYQHEPILLTWNKSHKFYGKGEHRTSVWRIDKPRANKEHPTMKPVELVANAMLNNSQEGDVVIDIYGGSGTTMVAGEQLGRKVRMMEIDPKYCQVIVDRMRKLNPEIQVKKNGVPWSTEAVTS